MTTRETLTEMGQQVAQAEAHLAAVPARLEELEAAGMYPTIPTGQFQTRSGGPAKYLYMLFKLDSGTRRHQAPGGKRTAYVGCKRKAVAEARRLAADYTRRESPAGSAASLGRWIGRTAGEIGCLGTSAGKWPQTDLEQCQPGLNPQPYLQQGIDAVGAADPDVVANVRPQAQWMGLGSRRRQLDRGPKDDT